MCTSPITIKNVNYRSIPPKDEYLRNYVNWQDTHIQVPCGHCRQCRARKSLNYLQQYQFATLSNWSFMFTLTYKDEMIPILTLNDGSTIKVSSYDDVKAMFKRLRKYPIFENRSLKYMVTDEFSPKKGRPHYHGILLVEKLPTDTNVTVVMLENEISRLMLLEWRRNVATCINKKGQIVANTRKPIYKSLCDYHVNYRRGQRHSTFDFHYITPSYSKTPGKSEVRGYSDVSYYVTKYFFKDNPYNDILFKVSVKECSGDYDLAQTHYRKHFRCRVRKSLNFSCIFTSGSYKEFLSTKDRTCLQFCPESRSHLDKCEIASKNAGDNCYFVDVISGKISPMAKNLRRYMDFDCQVLFKTWANKTFGSFILTPQEDDIIVKHFRDENFMDTLEMFDFLDEV